MPRRALAKLKHTGRKLLMYGNGRMFSLALFVSNVSVLQAAALIPQEAPGTMIVPQAGLSSVPIRLIHRPANPFPDTGRDLPRNRRALHAKELEAVLQGFQARTGLSLENTLWPVRRKPGK